MLDFTYAFVHNLQFVLLNSNMNFEAKTSQLFQREKIWGLMYGIFTVHIFLSTYFDFDENLPANSKSYQIIENWIFFSFIHSLV